MHTGSLFWMTHFRPLRQSTRLHWSSDTEYFLCIFQNHGSHIPIAGHSESFTQAPCLFLRYPGLQEHPTWQFKMQLTNGPFFTGHFFSVHGLWQSLACSLVLHVKFADGGAGRVGATGAVVFATTLHWSWGTHALSDLLKNPLSHWQPTTHWRVQNDCKNK